MNTKAVTTLIAATLIAGGAMAQAQTASGSQRPTVQLDAVLINTDPVPVQSGDDAEISFKVLNRGNTEAENVKVRILDSFPFQLKPDRKRNYSLGDVTPGQEYQISTEVLVADNAPDGQNSLKVRIIQGDFSVVKDIPVQTQSQDIELNLANLKTTPSQLTPDMEDAKMTVEVVNNGEKTAENVVLDIALPKGFQRTSSFSMRQALGNVAPGEIKTATFNFDIQENAENGTVKIPANLSYSTGESNTRITEETGFSFYLAGKPQFEVVNVSSNLQVGEKGEIKVTVRNTGSEKASSTRIRVLDSSELPFSYSSSSQYIGTLQPGQEGTAVFEVTTENEAEAKSYLLDFEVRGVKGTEVYVDDTTIEAEVANGEKSSGVPPVAIGVVLMALAGAAHLFRDRLRSLIP